MYKIPTGVDSIEPGLDQVIQLKDKGSILREKRRISRDVFDVCPDYAIKGGLRSRGAPDYRGLAWAAARRCSPYFLHFGR